MNIFISVYKRFKNCYNMKYIIKMMILYIIIINFINEFFVWWDICVVFDFLVIFGVFYWFFGFVFVFGDGGEVDKFIGLKYFVFYSFLYR